MIPRIMISRHIPSLRFSSAAEAQVLKAGSILRETRVFSKADVDEYSKVSLDSNPLHLNPEHARNAGFEDCVVHGMLVASLFPRIIAARFPGAIYASQSLNFRSPVYVGEQVVGEVEATNIRRIKEKYLVKFCTRCIKNDSLVAIDGEATAILPSVLMDERPLHSAE